MRFSHLGMSVNASVFLTFICVIPVSLIVSVEHVKYLNARLSASLSNVMWVSTGSFTAAHIKSIMFRVPAMRRSWSDNLHMYLQRAIEISWNFAQLMCNKSWRLFLIFAIMETVGMGGGSLRQAMQWLYYEPCLLHKGNQVYTGREG